MHEFGVSGVHVPYTSTVTGSYINLHKTRLQILHDFLSSRLQAFRNKRWCGCSNLEEGMKDGTLKQIRIPAGCLIRVIRARFHAARAFHILREMYFELASGRGGF